MAKRNRALRDHCDFELAMDLIGGKWKGLIIYHLFKGQKRFSELQKMLPNITARVLTLQLRELESSELVSRQISSEKPVKVEYMLTPIGYALHNAYQEINAWAAHYKKVMLSQSV